MRLVLLFKGASFYWSSKFLKYMIITMKKFGYVLTSRQAGKEAFSAFLPTLQVVNHLEDVVVDFDGVNTFSPSWGDEFLTPLLEKFSQRVTLKNTTNPSVSLTLETLENIHGYKFKLL